jgi:hypothetical protein
MRLVQAVHPDGRRVWIRDPLIVPRFPPPGVGRYVLLTEGPDDDVSRPHVWRELCWMWTDRPEDGWVVCDVTGSGIPLGTGRPPAVCHWLPSNWPATVFPLGGSPEHLTHWAEFVRYILSLPGVGYEAEDPRIGFVTLARCTRLLAHHMEVLEAAGIDHPLPVSQEEARDEVSSLLEAIVDCASRRGPGSGSTAGGENPPTYTLGQLIGFLDALERDREFRRHQRLEQVRRGPVASHLNVPYSSPPDWRLDEREMPGIRRIELLCDLETGEPGITAAKVRQLRARICRQQVLQPQHVDDLTLDEAVDMLERGVPRAQRPGSERAWQDLLRNGLAVFSHVCGGASPDEMVPVTGLSCKVVPGTTPTGCPDADPFLPPSALASAEEAIRLLYPLPDGTTIHWVGHEGGNRNRCRCHPNAPFAAPFDQGRWASVAVTPVRPPGPPVLGTRQAGIEGVAINEDPVRDRCRELATTTPSSVPGQTPTSPSPQDANGQTEVNKVTLAITMLAEEPPPKIAVIARKIGVDRQRLYDAPEFERFRRIAQRLGLMKAKPDRAPRLGRIDDNGNIEVEDEDNVSRYADEN